MAFPFDLPFYLGGVPEYEPADPGEVPLVYDPNHITEGQNRLIQQFKTKPRILALLGSFLHQVQLVEAALWQLLTERRLTNATGVALVRLGELVGQSQEGLDDDGLRAFIRARILLNRSKGRAQDIAAVLLAAVNDPAYAFKLLEFPPASFLVRLVGVLPGYATPTLVAKILRLAKAESVRIDIEYSPAGQDDTLEWTYTDGVDAAKGWGYDGSTGGAWASAL